jgi:hypothetical protein
MGKHGQSLEDKFWESVQTTTDGSCWLWTEGQRVKGYGGIKHEGKRVYAHRVAYELLVGPIPEGMDIGHKCHDEAAAVGLCNNPVTCPHHACCNPNHLKPESRSVNLLASPLTQAAINKAKTKCKRGHEFTLENTRIKNVEKGWRSCITCDRMTKDERKEWDDAHA